MEIRNLINNRESTTALNSKNAIESAMKSSSTSSNARQVDSFMRSSINNGLGFNYFEDIRSSPTSNSSPINVQLSNLIVKNGNIPNEENIRPRSEKAIDQISNLMDSTHPVVPGQDWPRYAGANELLGIPKAMFYQFFVEIDGQYVEMIIKLHECGGGLASVSDVPMSDDDIFKILNLLEESPSSGKLHNLIEIHEERLTDIANGLIDPDDFSWFDEWLESLFKDD
jgi:hypothetical protein